MIFRPLRLVYTCRVCFNIEFIFAFVSTECKHTAIQTTRETAQTSNTQKLDDEFKKLVNAIKRKIN